ncbi:MAG: MFS transporter [Acidobacteria bacterium]|nr:MFS transporter [Acidobacteriota bacterium]
MKRALSFIVLSAFLDLLGATVLVPVIPYLVRQYSPDALSVGLLALTFSIFQFIAGPALGRLSDRYGRRPILLLSVLGSGVGYLVFGFATALWMLFVGRAIDGITGGNISVAQAYIADVSAPEDRAKNFGLIGAAFGLGFIIGPALGGMLSHVSLQAPAFLAAGLTLVTAAFGYFVLPESLPRERRTSGALTWGDVNPIAQIGRVFASPQLRGPLGAMFLMTVAMSSLQTNFAVFTTDVFGYGPADNARVFVFIGVVSVVVQGGLLRTALKYAREHSVMLAGLGIATLGYAGIAMVRAPWHLYPVLGLVGLGSALAGATLSSFITTLVDPTEVGVATGLTQSAGALGRVIGPVVAGAVFDAVAPSAPYVIGAVCVALSLWVLVVSRPVRVA